MAVFLGISAFLCACKNEAETDPPATPPASPVTDASLAPEPVESVEPVITPDPGESNALIEYEEKILEVNERTNRVFFLSVDISESSVVVKPYLAFDRIFGFDYLLGMAEANDAYAAVNAGFFFEYGRPSGLLVDDGTIISAGTGKYYSLVIENGKAEFKKVKTSVELVLDGSVIELNAYNMSPGEGDTAVFSDAYGDTDRLGYYRTIMIIESGVVKDYWKAESPAQIPGGGYVVMLPPDYEFGKNPRGLEAKVVFSPSFQAGAMAYECASMLVEDGVSLAGDEMPWVGNLNHYDPRTCVGILWDGRLGFVVIDGRQKDYSSGTTGRETADILIGLGFKDAVMLDGGGSSQMIIDGRTVNSPSSGPEGRPIAGGFMIIKNVVP